MPYARRTAHACDLGRYSGEGNRRMPINLRPVNSRPACATQTLCLKHILQMLGTVPYYHRNKSALIYPNNVDFYTLTKLVRFIVKIKLISNRCKRVYSAQPSSYSVSGPHPSLSFFAFKNNEVMSGGASSFWAMGQDHTVCGGVMVVS